MILLNITGPIMMLFIFDCSFSPCLRTLFYSTRSIRTWDELVKNFLQKFFPINKAVQLRREIDVFRQVEVESFYEAWECFKMLIQKYPHHRFPELDGATRGAFMNRTYKDAYEIIKNIALNSCHWPIGRFTYGQKPTTVKVIQDDDKY
ncbi:Retrotransposon gag protein [Gossypium australe]|uniref:Retrotransposon gag protein n=1 Tax=Gossypium australe TaxID=47621 RepID=A0A5B6VLX2_9ROSI|nr:Retrotransposon gag protein [Gossypium australe]